MTTTIPDADATLNASDQWAEIMDPENEMGLVVEALFSTRAAPDSYFAPRGHGLHALRDFAVISAHLIGITVESRETITFIPREEIIASDLGAKWVEAREDEMEVKLNGE